MVRRSLDVGIMGASIKILINASVLKIEWLTGQEVTGKYQNFDYFQPLSLLVDTCRCSLICRNRIFEFGQLWCRTEIRKSHLVPVHLNAGIFCTLMQWYSVYCTNWKIMFYLNVVFLAAR